MLEATHLTCRAGGRDVLCDISLTLRQREVVGVIGPNGAGKSTLLKALCGLWPISDGVIMLDHHPLNHYRPRQIAQRIALLQQAAAFEAAFTVREVVLMGRNPYLGRFEVESAADRQIADDALRATDTFAFSARLITTLSGGERQRVFLARALAQTPAVLLLDEPIASLDVRHQLDLLTLTSRLARERELAVMVALHDLSLAAHFCDRLILLDQGAIVAEGLPADVLTPPNLARAFQIAAQVYADPFTGDLKLSING
ncbi:MAG: heme ABC transporter ATP-binding protein [Aggregatilineales bacterium]